MKQRYTLTLLALFLLAPALALALAPALAPAQQASLKPSDAVAQHDARMAWFRDAVARLQ